MKVYYHNDNREGPKITQKQKLEMKAGLQMRKSSNGKMFPSKEMPSESRLVQPRYRKTSQEAPDRGANESEP